MSREVFSTSSKPIIQIGQVLGDLKVTGWAESRVEIDADRDDLKAENLDDHLSISCTGDCTVHLPQAAQLSVESTHGDASFQSIDEVVSIQAVFGSLSLRKLGGAKLGSVQGDLSVKGLRTDLHAQQVSGDAYLRNIQGKCSLREVSGNLDLRDVGEEVQAKAAGNARLRLSQLNGENYSVEANGNVHCQIPEAANLSLTLSSQEQVIRIKLPQETKTVREGNYELVLGAGQKRMDLKAGGVLYLLSRNIDWAETEFPFGSPLPENFGEKIAHQVQSQIESQMEAINRQVSEQITSIIDQVGKSNLPPDEMQRIVDQARQSSQREMERSQQKLLRAQEKLERKLEAARRRLEHHERQANGRAWNFNFNTRSRSSTPSPPAEGMTDEERLMILRMLEQKKINLEEAERLISVLEGK